jgi:ATP-binding cassette subfamily C protein
VNAVYPLVCTGVIFFAISYFSKQTKVFSTGEYLAFNAAFGAFMGAMVSMTGTIMSLLTIVPTYERAKPILQSAPEVVSDAASPGVLSGDIEVNGLTFRYSEDSPTILSELTFRIQPGEFVAFVGPSGSGKSTLLRLLLGFETPTTGAIYYDGQDLASLDVAAVRRQLGVVLQNGQLLAGDLYSNIVGSSPLTVDDAREAARASGLEEDINRMPMGMHTIIPDGGGTLSGGQRQRLLIARAIANKPRIIYFDEATSALDNRSQSVVTGSLAQLKTTRIVIAHRLSTIIEADRIFVLTRGRIVQEGTFESLMQEEGVFKELASRQMV